MRYTLSVLSILFHIHLYAVRYMIMHLQMDTYQIKKNEKLFMSNVKSLIEVFQFALFEVQFAARK